MKKSCLRGTQPSPFTADCFHDCLSILIYVFCFPNLSENLDILLRASLFFFTFLWIREGNPMWRVGQGWVLPPYGCKEKEGRKWNQVNLISRRTFEEISKKKVIQFLTKEKYRTADELSSFKYLHLYLLFTKISKLPFGLFPLPFQLQVIGYVIWLDQQYWIYIGHHVSLQPLISSDFYSHPSQINEKGSLQLENDM